MKFTEKINEQMNMNVSRKSSYKKDLEVNAAIASVKNLDLRVLPEGYLDNLRQENEEIDQSLVDRLPFITASLTERVPFYGGSLLLVGAETGSGKSTVAANIAYVMAKNGRKALIISNEERAVDVYNRISCLDLGLNLNDRKNFSTAERDSMIDKVEEYSASVRVIDFDYSSLKGITSTVPGIQALLENIACQEKFFDCIILDYYQKIDDENKDKYLVLQKLGLVLERCSKLVKCPIVVLCQLHPAGKEKEPTFENRIKEGKSIINVANFVIEVKPDKATRTTKWTCHKNRFGESNWTYETRWAKGRFVDG